MRAYQRLVIRDCAPAIDQLWSRAGHRQAKTRLLTVSVSFGQILWFWREKCFKKREKYVNVDLRLIKKKFVLIFPVLLFWKVTCLCW